MYRAEWITQQEPDKIHVVEFKDKGVAVKHASHCFDIDNNGLAAIVVNTDTGETVYEEYQTQ